MKLAVDMGTYTAVPTASQVDCLKQQGVTRAIIGTSFGTAWQDQINAFEAGGVEVQEYVFPGAPSGHGHPYWIDCETPAATMMAIRASVQTAEGIYTRRQWWIDNTGDWDIVADFPWLKLWEAHYGDPIPAFVPFGGWTERAMVQYADSITVCGLNVDMNQIEEQAVEERETVLLACGDSPSGYRLYQLAVPPVWILDPIQAQVLKDLAGEPKPATWGQIKALGG